LSRQTPTAAVLAARVQQATDLPVLLGFGISTPEQAAEAAVRFKPEHCLALQQDDLTTGSEYLGYLDFGGTESIRRRRIVVIAITVRAALVRCGQVQDPCHSLQGSPVCAI
jgi:hypothetical protein